ncbi:MAG: c-type cytochrome [Acidobacteria bacterium]|nr:c-type cytochrome [Acidobacteriota bacterium]
MKLLLVLGIAFLLPSSASAQEAAVFFRQNCHNCHTIGGGRLTGPDLKDVTQRKDRPWLEKFILNPKLAIDSGNPYALQLQQEARGVVMPTVTGLTPSRVQALLDLIEAESMREKSQFVGLQISDRPFLPAEIAEGRDLFMGSKRLANGGASCVSCHTVKGIRGLGGGKLGPDLTRVYERLQGRRGLAAWLLAPASTTMQPIFKNRPLQTEEVLPLVALLEDSARQGGEADSTAQFNFLLLGLGGAVLVLLAIDAVWRRRFRAVRRPLVHGVEPR